MNDAIIKSKPICRLILLTINRLTHTQRATASLHKASACYYKHQIHENLQQLTLNELCSALQEGSADGLGAFDWKIHLYSMHERILDDVRERHPNAGWGQVWASAHLEIQTGNFDKLLK